MGVHLSRAQLLLEQGRHDLAEPELRQAIGEETEPALAHALLALCLAQSEKLDEATGEAKAAIHAEPDLAFAHYALGNVLARRERPDEAWEAAAEALRIDPGQTAYHALASQIRLSQRRWVDALEAAERGLAIDAEDVACNNLRATALVKLGRRDEAGATIEAALAREPENAWTHANQGWALLHRAEPQKAMEHFREALRLEPGSEWARAGIVEALKAKNVLYGLMLRYFLWMSRLSGRAQWAVVLGGYFGNQLLRKVAAANPKLAPYILPITIAYVVFALLTWIAAPLFNLFLRVHPFGKYALSDEQKTSSNWIGACLLGALVCLALWLGLNWYGASLGAIGFGILLLPLSSVFNCRKGWPRRIMIVYTAFLAACAGAAWAIHGLDLPVSESAFMTLVGVFAWGGFLSGFVGNALSQVIPRR
jgi:tetratricopeptide (TPR) repeat protein